MVHDAFQDAADKLRGDGAGPDLIAMFQRSLRHLQAGESGLIPEAGIKPVPELPHLSDLRHYQAAGHAAMGQALVIKLNGGLGTSMGLEKAKSLLPVRPGLSFLDLIARQTLHLRREHGAALPLLFMNSYSTDRDTLSALSPYPDLPCGGLPLSFLQNRVPRLRADDYRPVDWPADREKEWCPPGHGDLYTALFTSGVLPQLLARGLRYAFVSNADNLGAALDPVLLGYLAEEGLPFMMEVTARTEADRKGGHLACRHDGRLLLREAAQCPPDEAGLFQDIHRHRYFNTNNLWIDLQALVDFHARTGSTPDLPVIINRKTVDPRDPASPAVVQLETAMGSAIGVFDRAGAVCVPRSRFAPVKTTDDLLALWSDACELAGDGRLVLRPERQGVPPLVRLDPLYYKAWSDFARRFPAGAPSLLHCQALTVTGDVTFGSGVSVRGEVDLRNATGAPVRIAQRALGGPRPAIVDLQRDG